MADILIKSLGSSIDMKNVRRNLAINMKAKGIKVTKTMKYYEELIAAANFVLESNDFLKESFTVGEMVNILRYKGKIWTDVFTTDKYPDKIGIRISNMIPNDYLANITDNTFAFSYFVDTTEGLEAV